jgi:hypothetical protein
MDKPALQGMLRTLRAELQEPEDMDAGTRSLLLRLREDIEVLLELSSEAEPEHHEQVETGLRAAVERFEETHPSLTSAMNRVLNLLVSIGL